ncbi:hypothetical protein WISP_76580 [Willisornis vidua]|uniref:RNA-directed DNA polymerase from mobile element jockey n=1 Tax=Willisornis vidua TaxID=1566151 RepID=A0ABQ9DC16_9PASS|nr:hypothetical protein WISP_76580 [Willisornis vidua]
MGLALGSSGSILEPAGIGSIRHDETFVSFSQKPPLQLPQYLNFAKSPLISRLTSVTANTSSRETKDNVLNLKDENKEKVIEGHKENKRTLYIHVYVYAYAQSTLLSLFKAVYNFALKPIQILIFTTKTGGLQNNWPLELIDNDRKLNNPPKFQEDTVSDLLKHLDPQKSMGPDGIHPTVMRELAEELTKPLYIICQQFWLSGEVPDDWKLANVMPIHKMGWKKDP